MKCNPDYAIVLLLTFVLSTAEDIEQFSELGVVQGSKY